MRVLAVLSASLALLALWSVECTEIAHDLQLAAESEARPGEQLALRALLFRDVDAPEGPTLVTAPTRVRLLDARDRELAATTLTASALATLDGALRLPSAIAGELTLEARATFEGKPLLCRRPLHVALDAPTHALRGREAGPMQQLAVGRVYARSSAPAPTPFTLRVVGGACVPEQRCRLLVWVGEPAAAVALRTNASAQASAPDPASETAGLVAFEVIVRGPDAELTLQAMRGGELVAERAVRLPIGLGEVALDAPSSLLDARSSELRYVPAPGRQQVIFDLFQAGRWRATRVLDAAKQPSYPLSSALALPGLARVQAHSDRFHAESAGARVLYVQSPGEGDAQALATIARQLPDDEIAAAWQRALPGFALAAPARAAAFLLAPLEALRAPVPSATSDRPRQLRRLVRTREHMRYGVAGALAASSLAIALSIARRGLRATTQAEAILDAAREAPDRGARGRRLFARLDVLLMVLAVGSAFLAGALLIAAKPLWF